MSEELKPTLHIRTCFRAFNSSASHSLPRYTTCTPRATASTPRERRPKNRRFRSILESESLEDFAPVRWVFSGSAGWKSRLGSDDGGGGGGFWGGEGGGLAVER